MASVGSGKSGRWVSGLAAGGEGNFSEDFRLKNTLRCQIQSGIFENLVDRGASRGSRR